MAKALSLVAYDDLESQVEALERDGYVYFPGVLDADEIAKLRATMDRLEAISRVFRSAPNASKWRRLRE